MKQREKFGSRLGFILISAGCAIGLGNVYRFPIITGAYGGAIFVLIYLAFLLLLGIPVMCAELAVGRASQRSIATSFETLEKPGQKWHFMKFLGIGGNYLLMMFYTCISGWMIIYFLKYLNGSILSAQGDAALGVVFGDIAKRVMARDARRDISELVDSTAIFTPEVLRGNIADARYVLDALDIRHEWDASQTYRKGKTVWGKAESIDNQVQLTEVAFTPTEGKVPNVKGLGAKDAVYMLEACGLRVQLSGIGKVYTQSIPHGSAVKKGQTIYLKLK